MPADDPQLSLTAGETEPPRHRVRALAGILAGFQWPHVGLDRLTKDKQTLVYETARDALARLAAHDEGGGT